MEKLNKYKICRKDIKTDSSITVNAHSTCEALMKFLQHLNDTNTHITKDYKITITKMN